MRFVILLSLVGVAGCTHTPPPVEMTHPPVSHRLEQRADALFSAAARTNDLSGRLLVREEGRTVFTKSYGFADFGTRTRHGSPTRYSAASITKGLTAAAVVHLVRSGQIDLARPIAEYLPDLEGATTASVAQVLDHTAGLPRDLPDSFAGGSVARWVAENRDRLGPVGAERYSNIGYALLAEVVENVSGQSFANFVENQVLVPRGMKASKIGEGEASDYAHGAKGYTAGPEPSGLMPAPSAPLEIGASGLVSTGEDLAIWAEGLASGTYPEFFEAEDPLGSVDRGEETFGEYVSVQGSLPGYFANAISWNSGRNSVVFVGNLFSAPALTMKRDLLALMGEKPLVSRAPRPEVVEAGEAHSKLEGQYASESFGDIAIEREEYGHFRLRMIGKPDYWSFHLTPVASGLHWRAFDRVFVSTPDGISMRRRDGSAGEKLERLPAAK